MNALNKEEGSVAVNLMFIVALIVFIMAVYLFITKESNDYAKLVDVVSGLKSEVQQSNQKYDEVKGKYNETIENNAKLNITIIEYHKKIETLETKSLSQPTVYKVEIKGPVLIKESSTIKESQTIRAARPTTTTQPTNTQPNGAAKLPNGAMIDSTESTGGKSLLEKSGVVKKKTKIGKQRSAH